MFATGVADAPVGLSTAPLREAVRAMADEARAHASIGALSSWLQELERLHRTVEAAMLDVVGHVHRTGAFVADGHLSVRSWARATVRWSEADQRARVSAARLVDAFPQVADELAAGRVSTAAVRELARAHDHPRCGHRLGEVIDHLLAEAQRFDHRDFRLLVRRWESLADADGAHREHDEAHDARDAFVGLIGDEGHVTAHLGTAQLAIVKSVFDQYVEAQFAADVAAAGPGNPLPRTAAQRRADAFVAIFQAAAAGPAAGDGVVPIVNVVVDQATFEAQLEALLTDAPVDLRPELLDGRRCETRDGIPIDPSDAVIAAVMGHVRRVVVGSDGVVIDLGRTSRLFTGKARTAVQLLRARCWWRGCAAAGRQCDHLTPWAHDGPTSPANGAPACGRHNRWRNHGFRVERDGEGRLRLYRPDGTEITTV
jgi:hypothetical protein